MNKSNILEYIKCPCCEKENAKNQTFNLTYGDSRKISELTEILKKEFPDFFENESEWDEEDKQFRQLTKEMAWDVENDFKHMQYKMDFKYIKAKCDVQVEWYNKVVNGEIKLKPPYEKTAYQLDLEAYQNY